MASKDTSYLQKILYLEDQRIAKDKFLVACLSHPSRRVVIAALTALGRIGDTSALDEMAKFLSGRDIEYARTAAFALSIIGGDTAPKILTQNLQMQKPPAIRAAILLGIGRTSGEMAIPILANALATEEDSALLDAAAEGLTHAWSGPSEKWPVPEGLLSRLTSMTLRSESLSVSAAAALSRFKGDPKLFPTQEIANAAAKTASLYAKALLMRLLGKIKTPQSSTLLCETVMQNAYANVRIEAVTSLKSHLPTPQVQAALAFSLTDRSKHVVIAALGTISRLGTGMAALTEPVELLLRQSKSNWIRSTALKTLAKIDPEKTRKILGSLLADQTSPLLSSAVASLAVLDTTDDLDKIIPFLSLPNTKLLVEVLEEMSNASEDKTSFALKTELKRTLLKNDMAVTSLIAQLSEQFKWKEFSSLLASSFPQFNKEDQVEVKVGILNALAVIGDASLETFLENATNDPEKLVIVAAVNTLKTLTGKDLSQKIPLNSKVSSPVPTLNEVKAAINSTLVVKTTRGNITVKMLPEAPMTAYHFVQFAKTGFYEGKNFHRVVPGFVVQGGDPRGDGFGGPGYLIRDEVSVKKHVRGTFGIATAGRDTGGCQFFINNAPNLHLAGKYTLFGEVLAGMDVADLIEIGDKILSIKVR